MDVDSKTTHLQVAQGSDVLTTEHITLALWWTSNKETTLHPGVICLAWMWLSPPNAIHHYPTREDNLLVCSSYTDVSYMIAFAYPIFLIILCTVYAVFTRKIPAAFNESKYIGFTMYTTCVIWLAFVPIYFR
jgi:7 transmembrane sweet-taste receptor of 3 GCPR